MSLYEMSDDGVFYAVEVGGVFGDIGHFLSNAAKVCGREIGKAEKSIIKAEGKLSKQLGKIPIVGAPIKAIFDVQFHILTAPMVMTVDCAIYGKRIDKVLLVHLQQDLADFKAVGPYAQMVLSMVPGIGPGIGAAIGAGLALANGQPLDQVLLAGVEGLMPGGPLAKAAVSFGVNGVKALATHQHVDFESLAGTAAGAASDAFGLPPAAKNAMIAGIHMTSQLIHGEKPEKALTDGVIAALPVPETVKGAMHEATNITLDIAHGKRVDKALLAHVQNVAQFLPIDAKFKTQISTALTAGKSLAEGHDPAQVLTAALQSGVADSLINFAGKDLPKSARTALSIGVSMGAGVVGQIRHANQLTHVVPGKLVQAGVELAKAVPAIGAARKLAGQGVHGFDLAAGLSSSRAHLFDVHHVRSGLTGADKQGFDMALSVRIGVVAHPTVGHLSAAAQAGFALTLGMQGHLREDKIAIMQAIVASPSAKVGAEHAVKHIQARRGEFVHRVMLALKLSA